MSCETYNMLRIKQFCCCWSVRTGSLIIAYLGLIGNVLSLVSGSAYLAFIQSQALKMMENSQFYFGFVGFFTLNMSLAIAYHAIASVFHISLVWGIHKERTEFIFPWLVLKGLESCLVFVCVLVGTGLYIATPYMNYGTLFILIAIFSVCIWLVSYTFVCVFTYYIELKMKKDREEDQAPSYVKAFLDEKQATICTLKQDV